MPESKTLRFAALLLLVLLPLALRLFPLKHGGERGYVPDAHMVRQALGMARDRDPVPPVGQYSTYPNLVPYLALPLYGAQFAAGALRGEWSGAREYGEHVLEHPQRAAHVMRLVVALCGALTAWAAFRAARAAGLRAGAWAAAWLVATSLLHLQFSTHERPWVPMVLFITLSAWAAIVHATSARPLHLALSGLAAGLAFACHQSGLAALGIPFLAWLLGPPGWGPLALRERLVGGTLAVLSFAAAGLVLGHPYLLVHGRTPTEAVVGEGAADASVGGMSVVFGLRFESLARLAPVLCGYDPVLVLLGLGGLAWALRDRRLRAVVLFALAWGAFFLLNPSDHVRYLLPFAVLLALPAGMCVERLLEQPLGRLATPFVLAVPLVQAVRFVVVLARPDTRAIAEVKLASLATGARVAIDRYGPYADLDLAGLAVLERVRATCGEGLRPREQHRKLELAAGRARGGVDAVRVEELLSFDERAGTVGVRDCLRRELGDDPRALLAALGVTHVLLVDRRPGDGQPSLCAAVAVAGRPLWVVDPARSPAGTREAFLPTEMDFPLTALWSVDRPGPRLELVALER
ncbi:MAG: glycosyltransferase family 39 protein [Planctomycetes bacterium]|nr:glycosyltransferase family 39 protein [Planctomycetota bacterium]